MGAEKLEEKMLDTKQLIIDTAKEMLDETSDIEKITLRDIAKRAGVSLGLINYHFKSKDNLFKVASGDVIARSIYKCAQKYARSNMNPVAKLKVIVKELYNLSGDKKRLNYSFLSREIMDENMQTPLYLIPILKEIFGEECDEMQMRILALQILYPIQVAGLNPEAFYMYSGIDIYRLEQRDHLIDLLIDYVIPPALRGY